MTIIPENKDWIDLVSAFLLPFIVIGIGILQWIINEKKRNTEISINQKNLNMELFKLRINDFHIIASYMANFLTTGDIIKGEETKFLSNTKNSFFLFDKEIKDFINEIYRKSTKYQQLKEIQRNLNGDTLDKNLDEQLLISTWFDDQLNTIEKKF
jgi:hypothetical protein